MAKIIKIKDFDSINGTVTVQDFDPEDTFFAGNMDTDIVTDGLVLWLSKDIRKDKTLYDLSGNNNDVTFTGDGVSFDENGDMITDSNNGIVHSIIKIPQTEIITMEFTTSYSSSDIGDQATPITTFSDDDNAGMKFGVKSNRYISWAVKYKTGGATGSPKVINASSGATESYPQISQFTANKINHVAYRYNSSLKRIEIFINATPFTHYIDLSETNEPNLLVSAIGFFRRDANTNPSYTPINEYKNGKAYDIKAYNKMLSDEEILQNYNNLVKNGVISNG